MTTDREMDGNDLLALLRKMQPNANEREAWLLERLMGALGMVRTLTDKRGSLYRIGGRSAYEVVNEWMEANYGGLKLHWPSDHIEGELK